MFVTLKGNSERKVLSYKIQPDTASQLWAQCLMDSVKNSSLKDKNRFYNFNSKSAEEIPKLLKSLAEVTKTLQEHYPGLDFPTVDSRDLQDSVNRLHVDFAHSHHITKLVNDKTVLLWESYNNILHSIEAVLNNQRLLEQFGLPGARVAFTWHNNHRVPIPDSAYEKFRLDFQFGAAYANYPQVGRQFLDIFLAKDDKLADEHIQPMRYFSGDTFLWLGPTFGEVWNASRLTKMKAWFEARREKFNRLGFFWNDPMLALGSFQVAMLEDAPETKTEIAAFVNQLSQYGEIESVKVE